MNICRKGDASVVKADRRDGQPRPGPEFFKIRDPRPDPLVDPGSGQEGVGSDPRTYK